MDTFSCCTDVKQMLVHAVASLLACYLLQTHDIAEMMHVRQTFGFQIKTFRVVLSFLWHQITNYD